MGLHPSTFEYLQPSEGQLEAMGDARLAASIYSKCLDELIPDGPDKTYIFRKLREVAMWTNVAISRQPDGAPRS